MFSPLEDPISEISFDFKDLIRRARTMTCQKIYNLKARELVGSPSYISYPGLDINTLKFQTFFTNSYVGR